jgi:hypothetical protein
VTPEDFWALLWGDDSRRHEVHLRHDGQPVVCWIPCHHRGRLVRLLDAEDCYVSAIPRNLKGDHLTYGNAHLIWAALTKPDSGRRLERFRPGPTLVWRQARSSHRFAAWSLSVPLSPRFIEQATGRISNHLGGTRHAGLPEALLPSPYSGKWTIEFSQPETYTPRQVVGDLRDAPDRHAWRRAA